MNTPAFLPETGKASRATASWADVHLRTRLGIAPMDCLVGGRRVHLDLAPRPGRPLDLLRDHRRPVRLHPLFRRGCRPCGGRTHPPRLGDDEPGPRSDPRRRRGLDAEVRSTPMTRLMSAVGVSVPRVAWRSPAVLAAMGTVAGRRAAIGDTPAHGPDVERA